MSSNKTTIDISKRTKGEWIVKNWELQNSVGCQIDAISNLYTTKSTICTLMRENHEANAAFIVKACNSHDKLVEALKDVYHNYGLIEGDNKNVTIPYSVIEKIKELLKNVSVS